jgi:hypothetical protein
MYRLTLRLSCRHRHALYLTAFSLAGGVMSRKPGTLILLLANLAFALPALAQVRDPATLPQAQSANAKPLLATAQTAVGAKQWPAAEAALKQLVSAEPRWEYADMLGAVETRGTIRTRSYPISARSIWRRGVLLPPPWPASISALEMPI